MSKAKGKSNGKRKAKPRSNDDRLVFPGEPIPPYKMDLEENTIRDYYPELAEWTCADIDLKEKGVFEIYEELPDGKRGRRVMTLTVDPVFNQTAAERIYWLIMAAPNMWRALRDAITPGLLEFEKIDDFTENTKLLSEAAQRSPWGWPTPHPDEDLMRRQMAIAAGGKLAGLRFNPRMLRKKGGAA